MSTTLQHTRPDPIRQSTLQASSRRRGPLRKRFALVAAGLLSVLVAVLGVSFAGDTGTSSSTVTAYDGITVTGNGSLPGWDVSVGSAGTVGTSATIATIDPADATSTQMVVSVYVTNLSALAMNYTSWNFNLSLWDSTTPTPLQVGTTQVITSDAGTVSWVVTIDPAKTYTLKLDQGGSFYTIATDTVNGSLSPSFFVRASQL